MDVLDYPGALSSHRNSVFSWDLRIRVVVLGELGT